MIAVEEMPINETIQVRLRIIGTTREVITLATKTEEGINYMNFNSSDVELLNWSEL